jgi:phage baseplate assembly protein W
MSGMDANTGRALAGIEHLKQSIRDIIATPLIARVMRRAYGSGLFGLIDAPVNRRALSAIYAATAGALRLWEPRFSLRRVAVDAVEPGRVALTVWGLYLYDGEAVDLSTMIEVSL